MKKWILIILGLSLLGVLGYFGSIFYQQYRQHQARKEFKRTAKDTASENVTTWTDSIPIPYQNDKRTVHVYLPPGYATDSLRYPVIYLMDGSGCCSDLANGGPEFRMDEVIDSTVAAGGPGAIVFGIESAEDRDAEYTPWPTEDVPHAHGETYINWMADTFKPWVDTTFRTRPEPAATTIGGISRSGMMAYYAIASRPETFGNALVMSPSMWVDEEKLLAMDLPADAFAGKRVVVSVGELETSMVAHAKNVRDKLQALGMDQQHLKFHIMDDLGHEPLTWRETFYRSYPWIVE